MFKILTCGPNELLVVSGVGRRSPAMVSGSSVLFYPALQICERLSLNIMTIEIPTCDVYTSQGVLVSVIGVAQVKIDTQSKEHLEHACGNLLCKSKSQIVELIRETLEGHQRSTVSMLTVEDIYRDRKSFNTRMLETASKDMSNLGLVILSYTIQDVHDDMGYMLSLGKSRIAEVQRDARIGQALASRDAQIGESMANEKLLEAKFSNKTFIAQAERDFLCKKEAFNREINTQLAIADSAYELQEKKLRQVKMDEEMEIQVVEKRGKILLEEQEILLVQKKLESMVKQVADAEKFKAESFAVAKKQTVLLEAEAEAEAKRLKGEAEAYVIDQKAKVETSVMKNKAEAWKEYEGAAILSMYLDTLPEIVGKVGSNLSKVKSVKMVSTGDSGVGAVKLTNEVIEVSSSISGLVTDMTGIDLSKIMKEASAP